MKSENLKIMENAKIYKTKLFLFNLILVPTILFLLFFLIRFYNELLKANNVISIVIFIFLIILTTAGTLYLNVYTILMPNETAYNKQLNQIEKNTQKKVKTLNKTIPQNNQQKGNEPNSISETEKPVNYYELNSLKFLDSAISFDFTNNLFCVVRPNKIEKLHKLSDIKSFDVLNSGLLIYTGIKNNKLAGLLTYNQAKVFSKITERNLIVNNWQIVIHIKNNEKIILNCSNMEMAQQNAKTIEIIINSKAK